MGSVTRVPERDLKSVCYLKDERQKLKVKLTHPSEMKNQLAFAAMFIFRNPDVWHNKNTMVLLQQQRKYQISWTLYIQ